MAIFGIAKRGFGKALKNKTTKKDIFADADRKSREQRELYVKRRNKTITKEEEKWLEQLEIMNITE